MTKITNVEPKAHCKLRSLTEAPSRMHAPGEKKFVCLLFTSLSPGPIIELGI